MRILRASLGALFALLTINTPLAKAENSNQGTIGKIIEERSNNVQKRVLQRLKEQQNISDANRLYYKKHPDAPRIKEPTSNALSIAVGEAFRIPLPTNNDDSDPKKNPEQWDSIASSSKKCWFHKSTRKKVCEAPNQ